MLTNKIAVVTGGAKGIGKATVDLFTKRGATVIAGVGKNILTSRIKSVLTTSLRRFMKNSEESISWLIMLAL